jgi:hypothetical protein
MDQYAPGCYLHAPEIEPSVTSERVEHGDSCLQGVVGTDRKHGYDLNDGDVLDEDGSHVGRQVGDDCVHGNVGP